MQGLWWDNSSLLMLPHIDRSAAQALASRKLESPAAAAHGGAQPPCARAQAAGAGARQC